MPANGTPDDLTPTERAILDELQASGEPLDAIAIASRARLDVDAVLLGVRTLLDRHLVALTDPEPVHQRFATAAHAA